MEACGILALTDVIAERYPTRRSGSHWHITERTTSATMSCRSPHLPSASATQNSSIAVRQIQRGKPQGYTVNSFHAGCCFCGQSAQHQLEAVMWVTGGVEGWGWGWGGIQRQEARARTLIKALPEAHDLLVFPEMLDIHRNDYGATRFGAVRSIALYCHSPRKFCSELKIKREHVDEEEMVPFLFCFALFVPTPHGQIKDSPRN